MQLAWISTVGNEQKQPAHPGGELPRRQHEAANIGDGLGTRSDQHRAFLVQPTRQRSKALCRQHLAHRGGTERRSLLLERPTDVVDRVVALAQGNDLLLGSALLRLIARPRPRRGEELRQVAAAEPMTQHPERARRIAEALGGLGRREPFEVERPQGFVLTLARGRRFGEKAPRVCYGIWCAYRHPCTLSHTRFCVKPILQHKPCMPMESRIEYD